MTKNLKWRLGKLPTVEELNTLIKDEIITKEEARDILFTEVDEKQESVTDLKQEIKFLRELVEKLAGKSKIVETIKYIEKPYQTWGWYTPYNSWCNTSGTSSSYLTTSSTGGTTTLAYNALDNTVYASCEGDECVGVSFSQIN